MAPSYGWQRIRRATLAAKAPSLLSDLLGYSGYSGSEIDSVEKNYEEVAISKEPLNIHYYAADDIRSL